MPHQSGETLPMLEPRVLGKISENIKIRTVNIADTTPNDSEPNTFAACAPTIAAPAVLAIVLRESMAASGLSTLPLKRAKRRTPFLGEFSLIFTNVGVALSNTLSISEHIKEMSNAPAKYVINSPIKAC